MPASLLAVRCLKIRQISDPTTVEPPAGRLRIASFRHLRSRTSPSLVRPLALRCSISDLAHRSGIARRAFIVPLQAIQSIQTSRLKQWASGCMSRSAGALPQAQLALKPVANCQESEEATYHSSFDSWKLAGPPRRWPALAALRLQNFHETLRAGRRLGMISRSRRSMPGRSQPPRSHRLPSSPGSEGKAKK